MEAFDGETEIITITVKGKKEALNIKSKWLVVA